MTLVPLLSSAKRGIFLLSILWALSFNASAQDPIFSQFYMNKIYLNPAYAGYTKDLSVNLQSRFQWTRLPSKFTTHSAAVNIGCPKRGLGFGLRVYDDEEGEGYMKTSNVAGLISVNLPGRFNGSLGKWARGKKFIVSAGMQFAVGQKRLNWENLVFSDQLHPYLGFYQQQSLVNPKNEVSNMVFDISAGLRGRMELSRNGSYISMGGAIFHLNRPTESFFNLETTIDPRYTFHAFTHFQLNKFKNNPSFLSVGFVYDQQQFLKTNTLTISKDFYQNVLLGVSLRRKDVFSVTEDFESIILHGMVTYKGFTFGYSYDMTISQLGIDNSYGTHEFGIIYTFKGLTLCGKGGKSRSSQADDCFFLDLKRVKQSDFNIWQP